MIFAKKAALAASVAVGVTVGSVGIAAAVNAGNADKASVIRVIDGDTLVVDFQQQEITVRLLNIDTPETKDPDEPVECLGPEATEFLAAALPRGSKVTLAFDVEHQDRYGRTLAAVYDTKDRLINAEIARQGFGIPVTFGNNTKFRPPVEEAYQEAREREAGLFADDVECTVPGTVAALEATAQEAVAAGAGSSAASAAAAAVSVLALAGTAKKGLGALEAGAKTGSSLIWAALTDAERAALMRRAGTATDTITERHDALTSLSQERQAAEDETKRLADEAKAAAERAAAEEARQAAEAAQAEANRIAAEAEAARVAAAQAEANRVAAAQAEANRRAQEQQYVAPPPVQTDPYPGYTGPRCYAPGGKTWRPC